MSKTFPIKDENTFFFFPIFAIHLLYKASGFHFVSTTRGVYKRHGLLTGSRTLYLYRAFCDFVLMRILLRLFCCKLNSKSACALWYCLSLAVRASNLIYNKHSLITHFESAIKDNLLNTVTYNCPTVQVS